jgi:hypothetical protein
METGYDNAHEIHPYGFEPNPGENHTESDESESELKAQRQVKTKLTKDLKLSIRSLRYRRLSIRGSTLEWCKYGHCILMTKTIESFCR